MAQTRAAKRGIEVDLEKKRRQLKDAPQTVAAIEEHLRASQKEWSTCAQTSASPADKTSLESLTVPLTGNPHTVITVRKS